MTKQEYISYLHQKYCWLSSIDLEMTYRKAKEEVLNTLFPFNDEITEVPPRYEMKVLEAMEEIIEIGNMRHYTSYQENGVSWSKDYSGLSCLKDITPYAGR